VNERKITILQSTHTAFPDLKSRSACHYYLPICCCESCTLRLLHRANVPSCVLKFSQLGYCLLILYVLRCTYHVLDRGRYSLSLHRDCKRQRHPRWHDSFLLSFLARHFCQPKSDASRSICVTCKSRYDLCNEQSSDIHTSTR
jgi:hypothetical protein